LVQRSINVRLLDATRRVRSGVSHATYLLQYGSNLGL
jgi:hypothetical protein